MKFNFKLERLKDLKENFQDLARIELGRKIQEKIKVEEEIKVMNSKIEIISRKFKSEIHDSIPIAKLTSLIEYRKSLNEKLDNLHLELKKREIEEEIARNDYIEAKKEKDVLEKLKDKRYEEYKIEEKRLDIKELDELARNAYHYNGGTKNGQN
jgi:flagellar FliJ protein